jgi:hypothetical protein
MASLSLAQKLTLRSIANARGLMDPPANGPSHPGNIVGWDKITAKPIVNKNGALIIVSPTYNKGGGSGRSISVSAIRG